MHKKYHKIDNESLALCKRQGLKSMEIKESARNRHKHRQRSIEHDKEARPHIKRKGTATEHYGKVNRTNKDESKLIEIDISRRIRKQLSQERSKERKSSLTKKEKSFSDNTKTYEINKNHENGDKHHEKRHSLIKDEYGQTNINDVFYFSPVSNSPRGPSRKQNYEIKDLYAPTHKHGKDKIQRSKSKERNRAKRESSFERKRTPNTNKSIENKNKRKGVCDETYLHRSAEQRGSDKNQLSSDFNVRSNFDLGPYEKYFTLVKKASRQRETSKEMKKATSKNKGHSPEYRNSETATINPCTSTRRNRNPYINPKNEHSRPKTVNNVDEDFKSYFTKMHTLIDKKLDVLISSKKNEEKFKNIALNTERDINHLKKHQNKHNSRRVNENLQNYKSARGEDCYVSKIHRQETRNLPNNILEGNILCLPKYTESKHRLEHIGNKRRNLNKTIMNFNHHSRSKSEVRKTVKNNNHDYSAYPNEATYKNSNNQNKGSRLRFKNKQENSTSLERPNSCETFILDRAQALKQTKPRKPVCSNRHIKEEPMISKKPKDISIEGCKVVPRMEIPSDNKINPKPCKLNVVNNNIKQQSLIQEIFNEESLKECSIVSTHQLLSFIKEEENKSDFIVQGIEPPSLENPRKSCNHVSRNRKRNLECKVVSIIGIPSQIAQLIEAETNPSVNLLNFSTDVFKQSIETQASPSMNEEIVEKKKKTKRFKQYYKYFRNNTNSSGNTSDVKTTISDSYKRIYDPSDHEEKQVIVQDATVTKLSVDAATMTDIAQITKLNVQPKYEVKCSYLNPFSSSNSEYSLRVDKKPGGSKMGDFLRSINVKNITGASTSSNICKNRIILKLASNSEIILVKNRNSKVCKSKSDMISISKQDFNPYESLYLNKKLYKNTISSTSGEDEDLLKMLLKNSKILVKPKCNLKQLVSENCNSNIRESSLRNILNRTDSDIRIKNNNSESVYKKKQDQINKRDKVGKKISKSFNATLRPDTCDAETRTSVDNVMSIKTKEQYCDACLFEDLAKTNATNKLNRKTIKIAQDNDTYMFSNQIVKDTCIKNEICPLVQNQNFKNSSSSSCGKFIDTDSEEEHISNKEDLPVDLDMQLISKNISKHNLGFEENTIQSTLNKRSCQNSQIANISWEIPKLESRKNRIHKKYLDKRLAGKETQSNIDLDGLGSGRVFKKHLNESVEVEKAHTPYKVNIQKSLLEKQIDPNNFEIERTFELNTEKPCNDHIKEVNVHKKSKQEILEHINVERYEDVSYARVQTPKTRIQKANSKTSKAKTISPSFWRAKENIEKDTLCEKDLTYCRVPMRDKSAHNEKIFNQKENTTERSTGKYQYVFSNTEKNELSKSRIEKTVTQKSRTLNTPLFGNNSDIDEIEILTDEEIRIEHCKGGTRDVSTNEHKLFNIRDNIKRKIDFSCNVEKNQPRNQNHDMEPTVPRSVVTDASHQIQKRFSKRDNREEKKMEKSSNITKPGSGKTYQMEHNMQDSLNQTSCKNKKKRDVSWDTNPQTRRSQTPKILNRSLLENVNMENCQTNIIINTEKEQSNVNKTDETQEGFNRQESIKENSMRQSQNMGKVLTQRGRTKTKTTISETVGKSHVRSTKEKCLVEPKIRENSCKTSCLRDNRIRQNSNSSIRRSLPLKPKTPTQKQPQREKRIRRTDVTKDPSKFESKDKHEKADKNSDNISAVYTKFIKKEHNVKGVQKNASKLKDCNKIPAQKRNINQISRDACALPKIKTSTVARTKLTKPRDASNLSLEMEDDDNNHVVPISLKVASTKLLRSKSLVEIGSARCFSCLSPHKSEISFHEMVISSKDESRISTLIQLDRFASKYKPQSLYKSNPFSLDQYDSVEGGKPNSNRLFLTKNFKCNEMSSYKKRKIYDEKIRKKLKEKGFYQKDNAAQQIYEVRYLTMFNNEEPSNVNTFDIQNTIVKDECQLNMKTTDIENIAEITKNETNLCDSNHSSTDKESSMLKYVKQISNENNAGQQNSELYQQKINNFGKNIDKVISLLNSLKEFEVDNQVFKLLEHFCKSIASYCDVTPQSSNIRTKDSYCEGSKNNLQKNQGVNSTCTKNDDVTVKYWAPYIPSALLEKNSELELDNEYGFIRGNTLHYGTGVSCPDLQGHGSSFDFLYENNSCDSFGKKLLDDHATSAKNHYMHQYIVQNIPRVRNSSPPRSEESGYASVGSRRNRCHSLNNLYKKAQVGDQLFKLDFEKYHSLGFDEQKLKFRSGFDYCFMERNGRQEPSNVKLKVDKKESFIHVGNNNGKTLIRNSLPEKIEQPNNVNDDFGISKENTALPASYKFSSNSDNLEPDNLTNGCGQSISQISVCRKSRIASCKIILSNECLNTESATFVYPKAFEDNVNENNGLDESLAGSQQESSNMEYLLRLHDPNKMKQLMGKKFFANLLSVYEKEILISKRLAEDDDFFQRDLLKSIREKKIPNNWGLRQTTSRFASFFKRKKHVEEKGCCALVPLEQMNNDKDEYYSRLQSLAYNARRYFTMLVQAVKVNQNINDEIKLCGLLKLLERIENGDFKILRKEEEVNFEEEIKEQMRQAFISIYKISLVEAKRNKRTLNKTDLELIRIFVSKYRIGLLSKTDVIASYIGKGVIKSECQLKAAVTYLMRSSDVNVCDFEEFCGFK